MAVVGEANIVVRAITTGFEQDLRRQLKGIAGSTGRDSGGAGQSLGQAFARGFNRSSANIFTKISEGLRNMVPDAEAARLQFRSLVRVGYTVGTSLGVLIGGISSLVGGLVTLVGAVGRAAPALAGLASAAVQLRLAFAGVSFAMGGIGQAVSAATKQNQGLGKSIAEIREEFQQLQFQAEQAALSEGRAALNLEKALVNLQRTADLPPNSAARREAKLAYDEAELAFRMAKDRTQDLNAELQKGPEALNKAGGADPYAGLTESQANFARFLVGLRPKLDTLKEAVASGFLPILQTQIQDLVDLYFPDLEQKFKDLGTALGGGSENLFDNFLDENTKAEVLQFFDNLNKNIPTIGAILGEVGELLFKVFNDADGIGTRFLDWVLTSLEDWNTAIEKNGLGDLFANAYDTGSDLFGIIGNIFNGLGDFFEILDDSGAIDTLLGYLDKVTGRFAALGEDGVAAAETGKLFAGMADNFEPIMNFLGQIVGLFLELGANPAIKETFEKLSAPGNAKNWENIFTAMVEAGPALGDLVVTIGEIMAGFADAEAPTAFFETINSLIKPVADFFKDPANKEFVDTIGVIFAKITALTLVFGGVKFGLKVLFGNLAVGFGIIGKLFTGITGFFKFFGLALKLGPLKALRIFSKAGSAVAKIVLMLLKPLQFVWKLFMNLTPIGRLITIIMLLVGALTWFFTETELGKEIFANVVDFLKTAWEGFSTLFSTVVDNIIGFFSNLGTNISEAWNNTIEGIKGIWDKVATWFEEAFQNIGDFFGNVWDGVTDFFTNVVNGWLGIVEKFINFFINGLNDLIGLANGGLGFLGDLIGKKLEIGLIGNVTLPRLAKGGIVSPSAGGTLAQIAEAGKPERVEPLDENGLSKRDYAMIDALGARGGINITVNPSQGMDEKELARVIGNRVAYEIGKGY